MSNLSCAQCGAALEKPRRCTRCMSVSYCSVTCQRESWPVHKQSCKAPSLGAPPPGVSRSLPARLSVKAGMNGGFRNVTLQEPRADKVLCCCWSCGMLLKVCGPVGTNPTQDVEGPFWTNTFGRTTGDRPQPGKTFPALRLLGEPGSTGFYCATNQSGLAAACLQCAHALQNKAEAHVTKCERWLNLATQHVMPTTGPEAPNVAELRCVALIALDQEPDVSDGPDSIAGRFTKEGGGSMRVAFCFKDLEEQAFPWLLHGSEGFKGSTREQLLHYTMMRLYSADKRWREDTDYVVFSIHRLAAYGVQSAIHAMEKLPAPLPKERYHEIESLQIALKTGFM